MKLPLRVVRPPLAPGDLERGYFTRPWRSYTQYGCLFCQIEYLDRAEMEKHLREHEDRLRLAAEQEQEAQRRPLSVALFDASGRPITHLEPPDEPLPD